MATFTISAGGGIVRWRKSEAGGEGGSCSVDRHTCLYLMRNDKKERSSSAQIKSNLLHHFLFSLVYEKCSPWCLGTEATGAQPTSPQRKTEAVLKYWRQSLQQALPWGVHLATFSGAKQQPLTTQNGTLLSAMLRPE